MNLLSVQQLTKSYGSRILFRNLSFGINYGDKVGLIAKNGAGKSTLFKILQRIEIPDSGEVAFRKDITVSFLEQDPQFDDNLSVLDTILFSENKLSQCVKRYEEALKATEHSQEPKVLARLNEAMEQMNELNAWDYENTVKEILSKLNITIFEQMVSTLSGGQKKRLALSRVLINQPDLLIMDEPTNHLDIEMIEWLEHYLYSREMSLLIVTHDRYFLDEVCNRIIEIDNNQLYEYKGDFEYYLEKKAERQAIESAEIDKARNTFRRELEWVRKMPKARTTKSKSRVDAFYEIAEKAKQKRQDKKIELSVKMERLGSKILELTKITKAYGEKKILDPFTYTFIPGEKIGIIGKNGIGKSTFLNILQGKEDVDSGKVQTGETVIFGYYSQQGITVPDDKRIIEIIKDIAEFIPLANGASISASQLLTRFNFPPEAQYSHAGKLSGGEKRRLYLLTVLMKNPNFLILDEPTNDLDIVTLQTLEEFLLEFKGCVLLVSHDRYFMDRLVDHVFVFEGNGVVKDYPGNYTEYRMWKEAQEELAEQAGSKQTALEAAPKPETTPVAVETPAKPGRKLSYKEQRELEGLEKEIPELEAKKKALEEQLASGLSDHGEITRLSEAFGKISGELDEKTLRWLELQD